MRELRFVNYIWNFTESKTHEKNEVQMLVKYKRKWWGFWGKRKREGKLEEQEEKEGEGFLSSRSSSLKTREEIPVCSATIACRCADSPTWAAQVELTAYPPARQQISHKEKRSSLTWYKLKTPDSSTINEAFCDTFWHLFFQVVTVSSTFFGLWHNLHYQSRSITTNGLLNQPSHTKVLYT